MSRKRNCHRKSMVFLHSMIPSIEEYELEYFKPGCYCIPQAVPNVTPFTCAYLRGYIPQWTADCNAATYVVDMYGLVYYLSDFEHQMRFSNNLIGAEIAYKIEPACVEEKKCEVNIDEDEGDAVSPRKRKKLNEEIEESKPKFLAERHNNHYSSTLAELVGKSEILQQAYLVEEPVDV